MPYDYGGESFGRGLQYGQSLAAPFLQAKQVSEQKRLRGEDVARQQRWRDEDITREGRKNTIQAWIANRQAHDTVYTNLVTPHQDPLTKEWVPGMKEAEAKALADKIYPPMPVPRELAEAYGQAPMEKPTDDDTKEKPLGAATGVAEAGGIGIPGMLGLAGAAGAGAYLGGPRLARAIKGTPERTIGFETGTLPAAEGKLVSEVGHASELAPEETFVKTPWGQKVPAKQLVGEEAGRFTAEIPGKPGILSRIGRWFGKVPKSSLGRGGMAGTGFINPRDIRELWQEYEWQRAEKEGRVKHWRPEDFPRTSIQPETIPGYPKRSVSKRY